ncbi:hypothetical protein DF947_21100 [Pedobacter paludis]|uniref:Uncharacterized protein n=1 Tax=Pedobacter paludis TaxID=2203212 RepID=A0A317EX65_9SPHI|nr:hypothetical protein DF947_21100 [Pedobacter paludis]
MKFFKPDCTKGMPSAKCKYFFNELTKKIATSILLAMTIIGERPKFKKIETESGGELTEKHIRLLFKLLYHLRSNTENYSTLTQRFKIASCLAMTTV